MSDLSNIQHSHVSASASVSAPAPMYDHTGAPPTRAAVFESVSKDLPKNELGLPKFFYRSDLIPTDFHELSKPEQTATLNTAVVAITYREGYPTFFDGTPIWGQMDCESDEDFGLFQLYLEMTLTQGYRQLSAMPDYIALKFPALTRAGGVFANYRQTMQALQEKAILGFWILRAKAYDLFQVAAHRKIREQRLMSTENRHFMEAELVLNKLRSKYDEILSDEKLTQLAPTDLVKMMKDLAAIQREALGVSSKGTGKANENDAPANASMEVTLRSVAKVTRAADGGDDTQANNNNVIELLKNPEAAGAAQELIVKVGMGRRPKVAEGDLGDLTAAKDEAADLAMITGE